MCIQSKSLDILDIQLLFILAGSLNSWKNTITTWNCFIRSIKIQKRQRECSKKHFHLITKKHSFFPFKLFLRMLLLQSYLNGEFPNLVKIELMNANKILGIALKANSLGVGLWEKSQKS